MNNEDWFNKNGDICPLCKTSIDFQRLGGSREDEFQVYSGGCNCTSWIQEVECVDEKYTVTSAYQET